ncbi:hypothetical protein A167_01375 [Alcanivorax sp. S71-1-4]|uniref:glycosyltransferase n=1 Tax=Alcanivorax sp. S71-1-4 TaxID=1177159 RepID=UPI001359A3FD|nr:glycosyltransferase [Alcanivorax sp. S71-1-4]KAF0809835.1 hypothetical protein A167_01375 [Alcanivorax sp. S71-1-4]
MASSKERVSVLVIGSMPPPVGGVTIHIKRLFEKAVTDERVDLEVLDLKNRVLYTPSSTESGIRSAVSAFFKAEIIHIQISNVAKIAIALLSFVFGKKVIYTHHNSRPERKVFASILGLSCRYIVLVNDSVRKCFDFPGKVVLIPAFIPPVSEEVLRDDVSRDIEKFDVVLAVNAYDKNYIDGKEVYGIDLLCDAIAELSRAIRGGEKQPYAGHVGVFFFDPSGAYAGLGAQPANAEDAISLRRYQGKNLSFYELLKVSDLCLRPTRTDGDPLSIREALHLGVKVLASDVTSRPEGVELFSSGDCRDFADKLDLILRRVGDDRQEIEGDGHYSLFYEQIVDLYRCCLGADGPGRTDSGIRD